MTLSNEDQRRMVDEALSDPNGQGKFLGLCGACGMYVVKMDALAEMKKLAAEVQRLREPIPTRRALEVVLARIPMHSHTRESLMVALQAEIGRDIPTPAPTIDPDAVLARIRMAEAEGADAHDGMGKMGLIMRIQDMRKILRDLADGIEATTREADHG